MSITDAGPRIVRRRETEQATRQLEDQLARVWATPPGLTVDVTPDDVVLMSKPESIFRRP